MELENATEKTLQQKLELILGHFSRNFVEIGRFSELMFLDKFSIDSMVLMVYKSLGMFKLMVGYLFHALAIVEFTFLNDI